MKLLYSPTSPFVRKVTMTAALRGLSDRLEIVFANAMASDPHLVAANPLSKVPALLTDDGHGLFDSPVICEYLDSMGTSGGSLFPPVGPARWTALRLQALGDGIMDAAVMCVFEGRRPVEEARTANIQRQKAAISRSLDVLEVEIETLDGPWTIGSITIAAALDYINFRLGADNWLDGRPKLAAWFEKIGQDPVFASTKPKDAA